VERNIRTDLVLEAHELLKENEFKNERREPPESMLKTTVRKI